MPEIAGVLAFFQWGAVVQSGAEYYLVAEEANQNMIRGPRPDIHIHIQMIKDSRYL